MRYTNPGNEPARTLLFSYFSNGTELWDKATGLQQDTEIEKNRVTEKGMHPKVARAKQIKKKERDHKKIIKRD